MIQHRSAVMRDQNAVLACGHLKHLGIGNPCKVAFCGGGEIDCGLPSPDCNNDTVMNVGIGLEPNQGRDSPNLARARWSLSQRAAFSSDKGMLLASNSRAASWRYLSIS